MQPRPTHLKPTSDPGKWSFCGSFLGPILGGFWDPFWAPKLVQNLSKNWLKSGQFLDLDFFRSESSPALSWAASWTFQACLGRPWISKMCTSLMQKPHFWNSTFSLLGGLDVPLEPILAPLGPIPSPNRPPKWPQKLSRSDPKSGRKMGPKNIIFLTNFSAILGPQKPRAGHPFSMFFGIKNQNGMECSSKTACRIFFFFQYF